MNIIKLESTI